MHWWEWTNERTNKWTRLSMFFSIGSRSLSICSTVAVFVFGPFWYWFVLNSISWNTIEQTVCSLSLSSISLFSSFPCESVIFCGKPLLTFNWEPKHLHFFPFSLCVLRSRREFHVKKNYSKFIFMDICELVCICLGFCVNVVKNPFLMSVVHKLLITA